MNLDLFNQFAQQLYKFASLKRIIVVFLGGFFSTGCGSIQASVPQRSIKKTSERSDAVNTATSNPPNVSKWTHASDVSDYPASQQLYCNYICARRRWLMGLIFLGCQSQHPAPLARTAAVYLCTSSPQLSTIENTLIEGLIWVPMFCSSHLSSPLSGLYFSGVFICTGFFSPLKILPG